ncbi:eyes absent homolog isoform X3 [Diospyros lotus]|uniref:eyes absent homolog isoform X3 n=1 Tax=Diospyros lotus TaxID=55363 RepID=UPI00224D683B|nr:eyes absent homolog isoform X3 [Diospyros lotus]
MGDKIGIGDSRDSISTRKRKASPQNSVDQKLRVYIWDMDETLILLKSLLNRTYAEAFNGLKDVEKGVEIGEQWEKYILQVCDAYFFYEQGLHGILGQDMIKFLDDLYDGTDSYTDRWLSSAQTCLGQCSGRNKELTSNADSADGMSDSPTKFEHVNILVTSGSLIPSLVKCLLFRLDNLITYKNVYSSWEVGKLQCFSWIKERFTGLNVEFCVIGDGWEECEAAQAMRWPFVKIDIQPGGCHRFPGLTLRTLNHYFSVVYGDSDAKKEDDA